MGQLVITLLIVSAAVGFVIRSIIRISRGGGKGTCDCGHCPSNCGKRCPKQ